MTVKHRHNEANLRSRRKTYSKYMRELDITKFRYKEISELATLGSDPHEQKDLVITNHCEKLRQKNFFPVVEPDKIRVKSPSECDASKA
jgi:hypothetical protein